MATSKRGQAKHGIEEIFKLINVKGTITVTLLQRFEQYLNRHHKLEKLDGEQLLKNDRLFRIQKKLIDLSPETFDIVYRWIKDFSGKLSISMTEITAINNTVLEFALTEVFQHQRIHRPLCDTNKFDQLLAARFLRIGNKKKTGVYASLEVLLEKPVEEIKTKCIEYLNRKLKPFPLDEDQVWSILRVDKTIRSHILDLKLRDEGDPFIFYAASNVYQHHIHVLCAAEEGLEEYVFYPSELPSERSVCDHKFIGHLSENNYFSLEITAINNTVLEFALTEVFQHQRIHRPLCDKNKFDQLLAARFLRIANEKRTGVYASLEVLLEESVKEIKKKCIEYLKRKPKPFPLDLGQVKSILIENKTIDSHISDLESSDEGDPFILYAASIVYQHHIHVLCAAEEGLEEYVFYPSELPSERKSCDHKFIGHLSENNYFSLESTELMRRNELKEMAGKYRTEIKKKEENIKKNEEEKLELRKEIKRMEESKKENLSLEKITEENLKLSRKIKKKKEENLKLRQEIETYKQRVEDLEAKIQEMDDKNTIQFELLHEKMDKLLSNMSDSTNSKKAINDGKSEEKNKSAQVANSVQNNEDRDETSYVTAGKGVRLVSAKLAKHSKKGEHKDKQKDVRVGICNQSKKKILPDINNIKKKHWTPTGPPKHSK